MLKPSLPGNGLPLSMAAWPTQYVVTGTMGVPLNCDLSEADYRRAEKRFNRTFPRSGKGEVNKAPATSPGPTSLPQTKPPASVASNPYPCIAEVASDAPGAAQVGTSFIYGMDYLLGIPGMGFGGEYSADGGLPAGGCGVMDPGSGWGGFQAFGYLMSYCYAPYVGTLFGGANGSASGGGESCRDYDGISVTVTP